MQCIADGITGKAQTDDGNRGADNDRGHQLIDPLDAADLHDGSDHDVHKARHSGTDDQAGKAHVDSGLRGGSAGESGGHGGQEGEAGAEEHRALEPGEEQVNDGADAGAEQRSALAHHARSFTECRDNRVIGDRRHSDGRRQDGQQLLEGEDNQLSNLRPVVDFVNKIHKPNPLFIFGGSQT